MSDSSARSVVPLPLLLLAMQVSTVAVVAKATHEPHRPWFFTEEITPTVLCSIVGFVERVKALCISLYSRVVHIQQTHVCVCRSP